MFNIKQSSYILLFLVLTCSVSAKSINRQAYKVCQTNEEAYWNGSSAQCCDTTTHELVKNYKNGVGENGYGCCQKKENISSTSETSETSKKNYTFIGSINSKCCGGYLNQETIQYLPDGSIGVNALYEYSYQIKENGGSYYCAEEYSLMLNYQYGTRQEHFYYYKSDNKYCHKSIYYNGDEIEYQNIDCYCSEKDDPKNGKNCIP